MAKQGLLVIFIYAVFVTEHRKGVAAVMGSMLLDSQGFQSIIHVHAEILNAIGQISAILVQPFANEWKDGAVDRYDSILSGRSLYSTLEIFIFKIRLHF